MPAYFINTVLKLTCMKIIQKSKLYTEDKNRYTFSALDNASI